MIEFGKTTVNLSTAPFLVKMMEQEDNEIRIIVALTAYGEKDTDGNISENSKLNDLLTERIPIFADMDNMYEIVFEEYVFHMTRNESYTSWDDYEIRKGDYFILFEKSRLLDYLPHIVEKGIVDAYYPQGYKHYGVYCQNHIIDIVAAKEPKIQKL